MKKLMIVCGLLSFDYLIPSENNQKVWCDDKDDRNDRVEQWVRSQVALNRIKVLGQQTRSCAGSVAKKDKKAQ